MPLIQMSIIEGRPPELKKELIREVTDAVVRTLGAKPEAVRVILYEVPPEHWGVGGVSKADEHHS
ncbi:4-oxalocrotonate tautomerase [Alicyclobacillus fastidiosus]|uniref:Tautomerase n=1 Tax=Alicyclobacillus fastidiosus TaxID=392011 RepID=A0ABY6ZMJ3_9BACL|nr:4-oxalocrotonate tautomerase [Alicyclobacillus fastidiosus]WAH43702.1 4-oxalocrotonate tautomerase [Alicyclobacillus fastidiosus]GMA59910.1 4-oxalocrotonate tautomerase [Alicyclobacillus fastidiosus]